MSVSIESPLEFEPLNEEEIQKILASDPTCNTETDVVYPSVPELLLQLNDIAIEQRALQ